MGKGKVLIQKQPKDFAAFIKTKEEEIAKLKAQQKEAAKAAPTTCSDSPLSKFSDRAKVYDTPAQQVGQPSKKLSKKMMTAIFMVSLLTALVVIGVSVI